MGVSIIGNDADGNLYVECSEFFVDSDGNLLGDDTVRIYDNKSRLVSASLINTEEAKTIPIHGYELDADNNICRLFCADDRVEIQRLSLSPAHAYMRNMNELYKGEEQNNSVSSMRTTYAVHNNGIDAENIMYSFATLRWQIHPENQHQWNGAVQHSTIHNAVNGTYFTGVPYARGRDHLPSVFLNKLDSSYSTANYCAGDIESPTCGGTTGADCSGYASRVYDTRENGSYVKLNTDNFEDNCGYLLGALGSGQVSPVASIANRMDYWVKEDYHIMIHFKDSNSKVYVYDASSSLGFVVNRDWSYSSMKNHQFKLKNPWHANTCTASAAYYHNSTRHWNQCTVSSDSRRLNLAPHTWVPYGLGYKCSVCNLFSDNPPSPDNAK